jgi:hypothetical protein
LGERAKNLGKNTKKLGDLGGKNGARGRKIRAWGKNRAWGENVLGVKNRARIYKKS